MHGGLLTAMEIKARNMAKHQLEEEQCTLTWYMNGHRANQLGIH
jgi:hypothetical protein